jgi:hypothetical protein
MKIFNVLLLLSIVSSSLLAQANVFSIPIAPDETKTSGGLCSTQDPDFQGYEYSEEMISCKRNVSEEVRERIYQEYRIPLDFRKCYTIDHLVPLTLGGNNSFENLWPEHQFAREINSRLELKLYKAVTTGSMKSVDAVKAVLEQKRNLTAVVPVDFECEPKK